MSRFLVHVCNLQLMKNGCFFFCSPSCREYFKHLSTVAQNSSSQKGRIPNADRNVPFDCISYLF